MKTERENKLKCLKIEVVQMETLIQAAMCCELLDKLGERTSTGERYTCKVNWDFGGATCYNFWTGSLGTMDVAYIGSSAITATEWLNRHGVFVPGQEVGTSSVSMQIAREDNRSVYIANNTCVRCGHEGKFRNGEYFNTTTWRYIVSPYPEWAGEPEMVRYCLGDEETMISAESAEAIREMMLKGK